MKNGARYVVTTHWGTFSLDEGSYQDYLAGKLWICWTPGKQVQQQSCSNHVPLNVTDKAAFLRDQADKNGVLTMPGLKEAIAAKERVTEPRRYPSEDAIAEINAALLGLHKGQIVTVV